MNSENTHNNNSNTPTTQQQYHSKTNTPYYQLGPFVGYPPPPKPYFKHHNHNNNHNHAVPIQNNNNSFSNSHNNNEQHHHTKNISKPTITEEIIEHSPSPSFSSSSSSMTNTANMERPISNLTSTPPTPSPSSSSSSSSLSLPNNNNNNTNNGNNNSNSITNSIIPNNNNNNNNNNNANNINNMSPTNNNGNGNGNGKRKTTGNDGYKKVKRILSKKKKSGEFRRTGYVYDEMMLKHRPTPGEADNECPERIQFVYNKLKQLGILDQCTKIPSRLAIQGELRGVHTAEHLGKLMDAVGKVKGTNNVVHLDDFRDTYICETSAHAASMAAGSTVCLVNAILEGLVENGFAMVRPPGHHADESNSDGFCLLNNVGIAAVAALSSGKCERVMIVDFDVHHGNGTQHIFYERNDVLYLSIHKYGDGFYPGTGNKIDCGEGPGKGFTVNIPWERDQMGDVEYIACFQQIVLPIANRFAPDLILVSAGFDAADGDPIGNMKVTPKGFAHMTYHLMYDVPSAEGRVAMVLEGGYNIIQLSQSIEACMHVLMGKRPPLLVWNQVSPDAQTSLDKVSTFQRCYWPCEPFIPNIHQCLTEILISARYDTYFDEEHEDTDPDASSTRIWRYLDNVQVFGPIDPCVNLTDRQTLHSGIIVIGKLVPPPGDEKERKKGKEIKPAPTDVMVKAGPILEWSFNVEGDPGIWVRTNDSWYKLRSPSENYKQVFRIMYDRITLFLKLNTNISAAISHGIAHNHIINLFKDSTNDTDWFYDMVLKDVDIEYLLYIRNWIRTRLIDHLKIDYETKKKKLAYIPYVELFFNRLDSLASTGHPSWDGIEERITSAPGPSNNSALGHELL